MNRLTIDQVSVIASPNAIKVTLCTDVGGERSWYTGHEDDHPIRDQIRTTVWVGRIADAIAWTISPDPYCEHCVGRHFSDNPNEHCKVYTYTPQPMSVRI